MPSTSWIPTPASGRDDGAADRWDAGEQDWAVPAEWAQPRPPQPASPWEQPARNGAAWRADRERVSVTTAERSYPSSSAPGLPPVPRPASGPTEPQEDAGLAGMPEWRHRTGGDGDTGRQPSLPDLDRPRSPEPQGPATTGGAGAPLPPMPPSAWSKLRDRPGSPADPAATGPVGDDTVSSDPATDWDRTGGLEVIGAHVDDEPARGGLFRRSRRARTGPQEPSDEPSQEAEHVAYEPAALAEPADTDVHEPWTDENSGHLDQHDHDLDDHGLDDHVLDADHDDFAGHDDGIPVEPYDHRSRRRRRRRRRIALVVSLVVMVGLVAGVVVGGRKVLDLINPPDYTGQGTGSVHIRVAEGDSLKAIGQTMVDQGVIASVRPFTDAAADDPAAASVSPGIYGLHKHMSSKAALALLLDPKSRLFSRVTIPEGLTAAQTLQRVAQSTGTPLAQLQAAAAAPASLGLPAYANGTLEGFLFPATYDFQPGTTPVDMLKAMVARGEQVLDGLAIPQQQRLTDLTLASIVQAESAGGDDMAKVARVLDNRLATGMPLQLDTTVNYANGKSGLTTTAQDRANPSPYNTYLHTGLPPGPISNPGEQALRAVLAPAQGQWLYFVVVNPDTGETRFATTAEEHMQNVKLFQQWLQQHPGR